MARTETRTEPKPQKVERVDALKQRIEAADALLLTEYRGMAVSEITELRRSLREGGASFAVVKNTLMQRAVTEAGIDGLVDFLEGPSAVAFVEGDAVAAAKSIRNASRQYPSLVLKGGFMDGQVLDAAQATGLADLESREEMLSKIAGLLKSDMARAARLFAAGGSRFLSLLEAYREKVPAGPDAPAPTAPDAGDGASDAPAGTDRSETTGAAETADAADANDAATDSDSGTEEE